MGGSESNVGSPFSDESPEPLGDVCSLAGGVIELTSELFRPPPGWLESLDTLAMSLGGQPSTGASAGDARALTGIASAQTPRASASTTCPAMRLGRDVVVMV
jgi:hypothetical protein